MQHALLDEWADWMRATGAAPNTIRTRRTNISLLCQHAGTDDPVSITTRQLVAWLARCRSQWTRCTYSTSARAWHHWLIERGYRDDDPTACIPRPKSPDPIARPAPSAAIADLLARGPRTAQAYVKLATFQGLRAHEIAQVAGEHFVDGWQYIRGKGGSVKALPVHPEVELLRRGFPEQGPWFPGDDDGHVHPATVSKTVSLAFNRLGHHVTAHQLRHWFGTHAQRVGKDSRVTQQLLRHKKLASTQIYTEVADPRMVEIVRRLAV
jgi:site-specific recombinase XerD